MSKELFAKLESANGLPPGLLDAVWSAESSRGKFMTSSAGAQGHFQFMPATAKQYKLDDPYSLEKSASSAAEMYGNLLKRYGGSIPQALAAYNWGMGNVDRKGLDKAPAETRGYIEKIMPALNKGIDASKVSWDAPQGEQIDISKVVWDSPTAQKDEPSFGANLVGGLKKSGLDLVQGVQQLVNTPRDREKITAKIDARRIEEKPLMDTWGGNIGNIAGSVAQLVVPGMLAGKVAGTANTVKNLLITPKSVLQAATTGAVYGGIQATASNESTANNMMLGAAGGGAGYGAGKLIGAIGQGASKAKTSPEISSLADKAKANGIDVGADQIVNNRMLNTLSSVLKDVPFSGATARQGKQQAQLTTALSKTIGESSDSLLTALPAARARLSSEFENVLSKNIVKADEAFLDGLSRISKDASVELTDAQIGVVTRNIDNMLAATKDGAIDGKAAYNIKKMLDRMSKSNDSSLSHYAGELRGELMDALNRSLSPEAAAAFKTTRNQYKNMITLEKVLSRDGEGAITGGASLVNAARKSGSKELEELGRIQTQFLKDKTPDSGTARRVFGASLLGGGAVVNPYALSAIPLGMAANKIMNSGAASNLLLNGSSAARIAGRANPLLFSSSASNPQLR